MEEATVYEVFRYSVIFVIVFGILGNILVIISILKQNKILKSNYHFLILQLAICDLVWLIVNFMDPAFAIFFCPVGLTTYLFQVAGIHMMVIIAVLRYRATVHPLKPAISRRKLKIVCGLGYILGLITGYGVFMPLFCFADSVSTRKFLMGYCVFLLYCPLTLVMTVFYYKIYQALVKQNNDIKHARFNPSSQVQSSNSTSSLKFIIKYLQNRRKFLICATTVLCYGIGNLPISVYFLGYIAGAYLQEYIWLYYIGIIVRIAGSCAANPLIYGVLDKKLFKFLNLCKKIRPRRRIPI